jgi:PPOX class probable F420-dependent enzyme
VNVGIFYRSKLVNIEKARFLKMGQVSRKQENNVFAVLQGHGFISLTTFGKSGKAVSTPVRFGVESGKLYVSTGTKSGKVRRIRSNPKVQLAPCTIRGKVVGPTVEAMARILSVDEGVLAESALKRVVPSWRLFAFLQKLRGASGVYLEIVPVKEQK